jgi:hypothetical protein
MAPATINSAPLTYTGTSVVRSPNMAMMGATTGQLSLNHDRPRKPLTHDSENSIGGSREGVLRLDQQSPSGISRFGTLTPVPLSLVGKHSGVYAYNVA